MEAADYRPGRAQRHAAPTELEKQGVRTTGAIHMPPLRGCRRVVLTASIKMQNLVAARSPQGVARQSYLAILADWCKAPLNRHTIVGAPACSQL
jgi:hypothetical protein